MCASSQQLCCYHLCKGHQFGYSHRKLHTHWPHWHSAPRTYAVQAAHLLAPLLQHLLHPLHMHVSDLLGH